MPLPQLLISALEKEIEPFSVSSIQKAYHELSNNYRTSRTNLNNALHKHEQRISYLLARMPSTYETVCLALSEIANHSSENILSLLDVGSGPGTAAWAACEIFNSIQHVCLLEQNQEMVSLGKKIANNHQILKNANWLIQNANEKNLEIEKADIVIASYSFNEIKESEKDSFLKLLVEKTNKFLVIIDPGTPNSFMSVHKARQWFIDNNINIFSPCPHSFSCPAYTKNDWCHFVARVQRTSIHRKLKNGEKGYEDEKFSYLIVSKENFSKFEARVVRHPMIHNGHLKLNLCTENGFRDIIYSKKNKEKYKLARKAKWGDRWQIT